MDQRDPAAGRYFMLQLARFGGAGVALAGAMILAGRIAAPEAAGALLLIAGAAAFFFLPQLLARRWRSGK